MIATNATIGYIKQGLWHLSYLSWHFAQKSE
jgi:hypothetical protein